MKPDLLEKMHAIQGMILMCLYIEARERIFVVKKLLLLNLLRANKENLDLNHHFPLILEFLGVRQLFLMSKLLQWRRQFVGEAARGSLHSAEPEIVALNYLIFLVM